MKLTSEIYSQITAKMYGLIIIDNDNNLVFLEETYAKVLGVDPSSAIGKPIFEVFPETRLHDIVTAGEPALGEVYNYNGLTFTCNRYPIKDGNKIVGAFAHWVNTTEQLIDLIEKLKCKIKLYAETPGQSSQSYYSIKDIISSNAKIELLRSTIITAALSNSTILVFGETGTGKELVAHSIHHESIRYNKPFVKVNCAAIPAELIESELFGYEEGAFTGAKKGGYKGKFEQANGGTIFLDEVSQLSLSAQAKLLRVIQEKEISLLGSDTVKKIDVRIVACTNEDLQEKVNNKQFREDLYYRLNVIPIKVPPLRERLDDIPQLTAYFLQKYSQLSGKPYLTMDDNVAEFLMKHDWPGNIRELEHAVERAVNLCLSNRLTIEDFNWLTIQSSNMTKLSLPKKLDEIERQYILDALYQAKGNKKKAAELLGIARPLLYQKMKRLNLALIDDSNTNT